MLKTSDEAHDLDTGGWRLQIAGADANVMQVPLFLRFALTHLVLRQIESRASGFSSLTLVDSTKAVKMLSVDPALTKTVTLVDGRELTGLNLQEAYLEKTLRFCDYEEVTDEERFAVELWAGIVDDLRTAPGKAADRVEWVAKHRAIVEFAERRGLGRTGERYLDLSWTDIRNDRGVRAPLEAAGAVRMLVDPARVVERTHTPPNTRAAVRGSIIRAIRRRELDASVDWSFASFSVNNPEHATVSNAAKQAKVSLGDPRFNVRSAELEATEARARVRRSEGRP
jgi:proteasome accessory factor A